MGHKASTATSPEGRWVERYWAEGYAVARGVFDPAEVAEIAQAFDRHRAEGLRHGRSFRHGNLFYRVSRDANLGLTVRMVQWPAYVDTVLDGYRKSPKLFRLLEPLIGRDLKQIIHQLHWKPPGAAVNDFAYHQDCQFRRPAAAFRNLGRSYVQTGVAIDRHDAESGSMRVLPKSHLRGDLAMSQVGAVMQQSMSEAALLAAKLDPAQLVDLDLDPGDVALWSPYLVHGSGANNARHERRFFINGYVRAADCDRGEWAFRDGRPVALGKKPALVHYEELASRPEAHYVDD